LIGHGGEKATKVKGGYGEKAGTDRSSRTIVRMVSERLKEGGFEWRGGGARIAHLIGHENVSVMEVLLPLSKTVES